MVTRILLAAILCLIPAYAAARTDTGPGRDIASDSFLCCSAKVEIRQVHVAASDDMHGKHVPAGR